MTQPPSGAEAARTAAAPATTPRERAVRRVGVEEELLVVDAGTLLPRPAVEELLRAGGPRLASGTVLTREVKREQVEVVSAPTATHDELLRAVVEGRRAADEAAQRIGARVVALGTAVDASATHVTHEPRYERMHERFGILMDEQLTCGFHVHVTIDDAEEGVAVLDRIRPWLPVLLALSANSPFWHGVDSSFASYRYQVWGRWPGAGPYDRFGSAAGYAAFVEQGLAADVTLDENMVYADARLSTHAPTVEVRVADVCLAPEDAAVLGVLVRALVETAAAEREAGVEADAVDTSLLRLASWRASRWGVDQELVHPVAHRPCPAGVVVDELLRHVEDGFASGEERDVVWHGLARILRRGNGASRQRRVARAAGGDLREVVADALARTHAAPEA